MTSTCVSSPGLYCVLSIMSRPWAGHPRSLWVRHYYHPHFTKKLSPRYTATCLKSVTSSKGKSLDSNLDLSDSKLCFLLFPFFPFFTVPHRAAPLCKLRKSCFPPVVAALSPVQRGQGLDFNWPPRSDCLNWALCGGHDLHVWWP